MIIFLRLNSSFFSIFFNGYPLRLGKISSQRPGTPKRGQWLCQDGKTDISSCFFPFSTSQRDRRLSREQKRPRGIPKKKKKKKGKSENSWNERALQSWMLSLHNWSIRFWLHRFLLSAGETLLNFARKSYEGIFLIFIRIQDFLMLVQISQIVLAKYDFPF